MTVWGSELQEAVSQADKVRGVTLVLGKYSNKINEHPSAATPNRGRRPGLPCLEVT